MLTHQILSAICRTFLHSIWQGLLAAALAGIVLALTRRSSAIKRYNCLGAILVLCILATSATLFLELRSIPATTAPQAPVIVVPAGEAVAATGYWDVLINYLNTHAPLIMLIWGIVFLFKCFRMGMGLYQISSLRHNSTAVDNDWQEKVQQLARTLGIRRAVQLLESARAQVPLTTGVLKPCIFIPIGLLAQLPADQVEAILLHELAHIRRRDYLVNILQTFAESIFFFNPALLWVSARLREEREACCDDIAMQHTPRQASYLHALVAFADGSARSRLEMAFSRKQYLLQRVKRMLTSENQKLSVMEKTALIAGLVLISAFSLVPDPLAAVPPKEVPFEVYIPAAPAPRISGAQQAARPDTGKPLQFTMQYHYTFAIDSTPQIRDSSVQVQYVLQQTKALQRNANLHTNFQFQFNTDSSYRYQAPDVQRQYQLKLQNNISTDFNVQLKIDSSNMQYLKELKIDPAHTEYLKVTPLDNKQFSHSDTYTQDSLLKFYQDVYRPSLKDNKASLQSFSSHYTYYDASSLSATDAYRRAAQQDTTTPRKRKNASEWKMIHRDSSSRSGSKWQTAPADSAKGNIQWQPRGRKSPSKTTDTVVFAQPEPGLKSTAPRVVFVKPDASAQSHVTFKTPAAGFKSKAPHVVFIKQDSIAPKATVKTTARVVFDAPKPALQSTKPTVIFVKPAPAVKKPVKMISEKTRVEFKKAPAKTEPKPADKKGPLEEILPPEFYNSLILPKQIDC